jgi:hypothetical protein
MPADFLTWLFSKTNARGDLSTYLMDAHHVYQRIRFADVIADGSMSAESAWLWPPADAEGTIASGCTILFYHPFFSDFSGSFLQMTVQEDAEDVYEVDSLGVFNNRVTSILQVKTPLEDNRCVVQYFSFRDMFLDKWKDEVDTMCKKAADDESKIRRITRDGEPTMTWYCFPSSTSGLSPDEIYLYISQDLHIDIKNWPDYDARITYWIHLYIDADNQHIRGYVAKINQWVESGKLKGKIQNGIYKATINGMNSMNEALRAELDTMLQQEINNWGITAYNLKRLYYLPGRQVDGPPVGLFSGSTYDDITIVVEITDIEIGGTAWPAMEGALFKSDGKSLSHWLDKKRTEYKELPLGKDTLRWYKHLKVAGIQKKILLDKNLRRAAQNLIKSTSRLFKSEKEKFSEEDNKNLAVLLDGLKEITPREDMKLLKKMDTIFREFGGKTLPEIEKSLDYHYKRW